MRILLNNEEYFKKALISCILARHISGSLQDVHGLFISVRKIPRAHFVGGFAHKLLVEQVLDKRQNNVGFSFLQNAVSLKFV